MFQKLVLVYMTPFHIWNYNVQNVDSCVYFCSVQQFLEWSSVKRIEIYFLDIISILVIPRSTPTSSSYCGPIKK